jgi:hypothetical protein
MEGLIGARVGDSETTASEGSYLLMRRAIPHALWNATDVPARIQIIIDPGGFEGYFDELEMSLRDSSSGDPISTRDELARKYDQPLVPEWIPELKAKYGVLLPGESEGQD